MSGFPIIINGVTYTEAQFNAYGYEEALPSMINNVAVVAGVVQSNSDNANASATAAAASSSAATTAKTQAETARDVAVSAAVSTDYPYASTSGTASAYTVNLTPDRVVGDGFSLRVKFHVAPTAGATLKIDNQPAYPLANSNGDNIFVGNFAANHVDILIFDASIGKFKLAMLGLPFIQKPEAVFPIAGQVVSINPTLLQATPYAPIYSNVGAVMGALTVARFQISTNATFTAIVHSANKTVASFNELIYNIGLLAKNTTHYWRVQYEDAKGNVSEWSNGAQFITAASYLFDMLAVSHNTAPSDSRNLTVYDVDVATYTIQNIIADADKIKSSEISFSEWDYSGRFLAVTGNFSAKLAIYDYGDGIPVRLTLPSWLVTELASISNSYVVRFNKAGTRIFIGGYGCAICANFSSSTGIGSKITLPTVSVSGVSVLGADFSFDNNYLIFTTQQKTNSGYIHVFAWRDSAGNSLANPVLLSSFFSADIAHYLIIFHPRYNQFYTFCTAPATLMYKINTNNTIDYMGGLANVSGEFIFGLVCNAAGTRLFGHSNNAGLRMWNIDKADATIAPTYLTSSSDIGSASGYSGTLSIKPTGNVLAVATGNFPLGAKPKLFDISNDTFVDITNTIPFAYFTDSGTHPCYGVAYRFGKFGYPAGV